jgi:hypothetical protein
LQLCPFDYCLKYVAVAVALAVLATVGTLLIPPLVPWAHGAVFVFLFYAGIRGILTLRYTSTLLPFLAYRRYRRHHQLCHVSRDRVW